MFFFFRFFRLASFLGPFPFDNFVPFFNLLAFFGPPNFGPRLRGRKFFLPGRLSTRCKFCTYSWNRTLANLLSNSSISSTPYLPMLLLLRNVSTLSIRSRVNTTGIGCLVLFITVSISQRRFLANTNRWSISMVFALPSFWKLSNFFCFFASCWNAPTYFWVSMCRFGKFTWKLTKKKYFRISITFICRKISRKKRQRVNWIRCLLTKSNWKTIDDRDHWSFNTFVMNILIWSDMYTELN